MKICLVTAFPPSKRGLNEYGFHIARELQQDPLLSLTILADELETPEPELDGYNVNRVWGMNLLSNPARLLRAVRDIKPDVVWFNLLFSTLGRQPTPSVRGPRYSCAHPAHRLLHARHAASPDGQHQSG